MCVRFQGYVICIREVSLYMYNWCHIYLRGPLIDPNINFSFCSWFWLRTRGCYCSYPPFDSFFASISSEDTSYVAFQKIFVCVVLVLLFLAFIWLSLLLGCHLDAMLPIVLLLFSALFLLFLLHVSSVLWLCQIFWPLGSIA